MDNDRQKFEAKGTESQAKEQNNDVVDASADTTIYPADLGHTVTSHGDGSPSISPQLVERREELAEFNGSPDRDNEAVAKRLGLK